MTEMGNKPGDRVVLVEGIGEVDLGLASTECKVCNGTGCRGMRSEDDGLVMFVCQCVLDAHARRKATHQDLAERIVSLKGVAKMTWDNRHPGLPPLSVHAGEVQKGCTQGAALEPSKIKGGGK